MSNLTLHVSLNCAKLKVIDTIITSQRKYQLRDIEMNAFINNYFCQIRFSLRTNLW